MQQILKLSFLSFCFTFALGCGSQDTLAPVMGSVTIEGKPFTTGKVMFFPIAPKDKTEAGRPAYGHLDSEGKYSLSTHSKNDGALVGNHRVMIFHSKDSSPYNFSRFPIPDGNRSVVEGENIFNFDITTEQIKSYKK